MSTWPPPKPSSMSDDEIAEELVVLKTGRNSPHYDIEGVWMDERMNDLEAEQRKRAAEAVR